MAGNPGGPLALIGITPSFVSNLVTTSVSSTASQVFQGVGKQSLLTQAGGAIIGNIASSVVNVGINSALGTEVANASGLNLSTGANILASTITPYVTGQLAAGLNQSIEQSLKGAGAFGPVLAQIGTGFVNRALNGITNRITGLTSSSEGQSGTKYFPGAGSEPAANYNGGKSYTLGSNGPDVTFAIRPANAGPLTWGGLSSSINTPSVPTTVPLTSQTNSARVVDPAVNAIKLQVIPFTGGSTPQ